MRIYVASSWRNKLIDSVIDALRDVGHDVYDFREDGPDGAAFNWSDIDPDWQKWRAPEFIENLDDPIAQKGFDRDFDALKNAEAVLLVLPCGKSAHLELGYACGRKPTAVLLLDQMEPELMYKMVDRLCTTEEEVLVWMDDLEDARSKLFKNEAQPITKARPE